MSKRNTSGFTLIELIVVIAIIVILASVILASLATARNKGSNASIKADISNMRPQAEIIYDIANPTSYIGVCADLKVEAAITAAAYAGGATVPVPADWLIGKNGTATTVTCHSSTSAWAAEAPLKTAEGANTFWCVSSNGFSKGEPGTQLTANTTVCP